MMLPRIQNYTIKHIICQKLCFHLYEAESNLDGNKVFIKVLDDRLAQDETNVFNYLNGARLAKLLQNERVSQIHHFGSDNGNYLIVSEPTGIKPLSFLIKEEFPIDLGRAAGIVLKIAQTLREVHLQGVVHGLLNPSSIYFTDDSFKIDDFGYTWIVRDLLKNGAAEASLLVNFMSPEVYFQTSHIDGRADIYSLGVILLQMLSDELMSNGEIKVSFKHQRLTNMIPQIKRVFPRNSDLVGRILTKSIARNPDERYQNLKDFILELQQLADEKPLFRTRTLPLHQPNPSRSARAD